MPARFHIGQTVATPAALAALTEARQPPTEAGQPPTEFLRRHVTGDWGEVDAEDQQANEDALLHSARLLSAYRTSKNVRIWVITEADRSATTILLPEDY